MPYWRKLILCLSMMLWICADTCAEIPGIEGTNALELLYTMEDVGFEPLYTEYGFFDKGVKYGGYYYDYASESLYDDSGTRASFQITANQANEICCADFLMTGADNKFISAAAVLVAPTDEAILQVLAFVELHLKDREMATITIDDALWQIYPQDNRVLLRVEDIEAEAFIWEMLLADLQE